MTDAPGPREKWLWVQLAFVYAASRLPLLPLGFSNDSDAWSVANTARLLVATGRYAPSRVPGHPFHEGVEALVVSAGGALGSNAVTLAVSLVLLWITWDLGRRLAVPRYRWAVLALALHPVFWIASADSTDFILAAALAYGALLCFLRRHTFGAGVLLGLACASRVETLAFVVPLCILDPGGDWNRRARAFLVAGLVALCSFVPVFVAYWQSPPAMSYVYIGGWGLGNHSFAFVAGLWSAFGLVSTVALVTLLAARRRDVMAGFIARDRVILAATSLFVVYLVITAIHPTKSTYYLSALPLLLLGLAQIVRGFWRWVIVGAFLSYSFVYPDIVDREPGGFHLGFHWNNGLVVKDWIARWNAANAAANIDRNREPGSLLVLGYWLPIWLWSHPEATRVQDLVPGLAVNWRDNAAYLIPDGTRVVHRLDRAGASVVRQASVPLAYGEGIDGFLTETYGYDIRQFGGRSVEVRELGGGVSERFALPCLVRCGMDETPFASCVRGCMADCEAPSQTVAARDRGQSDCMGDL